MRLIIFVGLFVCFAYTAAAQSSDSTKHTPMQDSIGKGMADLKALNARMDSLDKERLKNLEAQAHKYDSADAVRGLDAFVALQKERDEKLTRQLWIKGSFFACMLAVTVVGVVRRRRKLKQQG